MGKNIIYLPVYYENGDIRAAASPFWLTKEGKMQQLKPLGNADDIVVISGVEPYHWNSSYLNCMTGTSVTGRSSKEIADTLCTIAAGLTIQHTTYKLSSPFSYRYLRLNLPSDSIALGDLSFYSSEGKIQDVRIISTLIPT